MPGRRTSRSRQAVSGVCCTCKNASADAKPCTRNPTDWSRSSSEFRSASSSSTTTMSGTLHIPFIPFSLVSLPGNRLILHSTHADAHCPAGSKRDRVLEHTVSPAGVNVYHPLGKMTRLWGEEAELIRESDELGEGLGAHLGH